MIKCDILQFKFLTINNFIIFNKMLSNKVDIFINFDDLRSQICTNTSQYYFFLRGLPINSCRYSMYGLCINNRSIKYLFRVA